MIQDPAVQRLGFETYALSITDQSIRLLCGDTPPKPSHCMAGPDAYPTFERALNHANRAEAIGVGS